MANLTNGNRYWGQNDDQIDSASAWGVWFGGHGDRGDAIAIQYDSEPSEWYMDGKPAPVYGVNGQPVSRWVQNGPPSTPVPKNIDKTGVDQTERTDFDNDIPDRIEIRGRPSRIRDIQARDTFPANDGDMPAYSRRSVMRKNATGRRNMPYRDGGVNIAFK